METKDNIKESGDSTEEYVSLNYSLYVGGNKMSSSLRDRLKRSRMSSSPLSRPVNSTFTTPVASRSKLFESSPNVTIEEYSREDIEKSMNESEIKESDLNEPDQAIIKEVVSLVDANFSMDNHPIINYHLSVPKINENTRKKPDLQMNENAADEQNINENSKIQPGAKMNINTIFESYIEVNKNVMTESDTKINENATNEPEHVIDVVLNKPNSELNCSRSYSKQSFTNDTVELHLKLKENEENVYSYSKEDIEKCADKDKLLEIYSNLQKETSKNEEILRKLKLVQKHHTKNNPAALIDLTQKWLTCTQNSLRMLYEFMPEPRSITFENFLIFLQVDFDIVKYNPENDTFS